MLLPTESSIVRQSMVAVILLSLASWGTAPAGGALLREDPPSCLEGRNRCKRDATCRVLLETITKVCDQSIYTCQTSNRVHCHSVLSALQTNVFFQSCICDPQDPDASDCLDLQKRIFLHSCVSYEGASPNISWIIPPQSNFDDDRDDDLIDNEPEERDVSCIGIRKLCLQNKRCHDVLAEFRAECRENKKMNQCIATDWQRCSTAMYNLRAEMPDLFQCQCTMKRPLIREKCNRIRARIAVNICLVSVPYLLHSAKFPELTFEQQRLMVDDKNTATPSPDSTCRDAFADCNSDHQCRSHLERYLTACAWNQTSNYCDREGCNEGIKEFYRDVRQEVTQSLLFCRCRADDDVCRSLQGIVLPTCSLIELPPPSCSDLLERCTEEKNCRERWQNYDRYCGYDKNVGGCRSNLLCRQALLTIMGTLLTTNCTCGTVPGESLARCLDARQRLHHHNICKDLSIEEFHNRFKSNTSALELATNTGLDAGYGPSTSVITNSLTFSADGHTKENIPTGRIISTGGRIDCNRYLSQNNLHSTVVRVYLGGAYDCSDLCHCHRNGSVSCTSLPCSQTVACRDRDVVYIHGTSFVMSERGQCRCVKEEIVCAKSRFRMNMKEGLFLHLGFSVVERYLIEDNSEVRFKSSNMINKLSFLLNQASTEEICVLTLHYSHDGNIVYEIRISKSSSSPSSSQSCIYPAKILTNMINTRHSTVVSDAELSILKVAQLERIQFHEESNGSRKERKSPSPSSSRSGAGEGGHRVSILTRSFASKHHTLLLYGLLSILSIRTRATV